MATSSAMEPVVFKRRRNAISRSEREWRVEASALVTRGGSGAERRYPWSDFIAVRLCFSPTRLKPWRYVFELQSRQGKKIEIDNAHYAGAGDFEDRSATYKPFVEAALAALRDENPKARALIGETPKRYFLLMLAALVGLGALAYVMVAVPTPLDSWRYAALAKFVIILLMLPIFFRLVIGAVPRGFPLDQIPERALPPVDAGACPRG